MDSLPQYDKEEKSFDAGASGGEDKEENITRSALYDFIVFCGKIITVSNSL